MSTEIYLPQIPKSAVIPNALIAQTDSLWNASTAYPGELNGTPETDVRNLQFSPWCNCIWKRVFDLACVTPALVLLAPLLGFVAIAIRLTSTGPVIFRQRRAGKHRKLFTIYKFRTMVENSESMGPRHTAKGDPRITPIGNFLRRFKLDELPQLYNVLRGDMSLVGPRPKLPDHEHTQMTCRPGVTGAATLAFRDEQHILCEVPTERLEAFYKEHVIPIKIKLDTEYMQKANLASDLIMLCDTVMRGGDYLTHRELLLCSNCSVTPASSRPYLLTQPAGD